MVNWKQTIDPKTGRRCFIDLDTGKEDFERPSNFGILDESEIDINDTNVAMIGSPEDLQARMNAARTDDNWKDVGQEPGLLIWRVENKYNNERGMPDFGIKSWPNDRHGEFHKGDSYIVLNSRESDGEKLFHDIHFWIGTSSSQDEYSVAAYKAVELDDLLGGEPKQHREVMGFESPLFQTYFPMIEYLDGGIESGFRPEKPEAFIPVLLRIRKTSQTTKAFEVPCEGDSLTHADAFILDLGASVYVFFGENCSPFEKTKAAFVQQHLVDSRCGRSEKRDVDSGFWDKLGCTEAHVRMEDHMDDEPEDAMPLSTWVIEGEPGSCHMTKLLDRSIPPVDELEKDKTYLIDGQNEVFVWTGSLVGAPMKAYGLQAAHEYLKRVGRNTPITRLLEGQSSSSFVKLMAAA